MTEKITDLASKHLGNKGEYSHYDKVDQGLLVAIPRSLSRAESNVTVRMDGYDVWNCFEFSCLRYDGVPVSGRLKLSYDANSEFLVESKSLKLYLNSWNFEKISADDNETIIKIITKRIREDLEKALNTSVQVQAFFQLFDDIEDLDPINQKHYNTIDKIVLPKAFDHSKTQESKTYLENKRGHIAGTTQFLHSSNLRSNCRVTHQPDWGDVFIMIESDHGIDEASFLRYILSLRKQDHFHEECCEMILNDLYHRVSPSRISVVCLYTRRGGIDINPVRFKGAVPDVHPEFRNSNITFRKTFRQ